MKLEKMLDGTVEAMYAIFEKAKKYDELAKLNRTKLLHCSFCGKTQDTVNKLIAGPGVFICDECVDLCQEIIDEEVPRDEEAQEPVREQTGDVQADRS